MCVCGNVCPGRCTYTETHWQQYYAAYCMTYLGHTAPEVPTRLAQLSGVSGTFKLTLNLCSSASFLTSWVRLGLDVDLECCCYREVQWHQNYTQNHIGQATPAVPRCTAQPTVGSGAFRFQFLLT